MNHKKQAKRAKSLRKMQLRINELQTICAEAYQVVGLLAHEGGRFDDDGVIKALDNLSMMKLVHNDVLPLH